MTTTSPATRPDWRGLALLVFAVSGWGSNWAPLKLLLLEVPPLTSRAIGGGGGALLLMLIMAGTGTSLRVPPGLWPRLAFYAVLNITTWMGLVSVALLWLDASEAVVITYTVPVWGALIAWPLLDEAPTPRRLLALVCGVGGVAMVMLGRGWDVGLAKLPGVLLCLTASICFALGTVLIKRSPLPLAPGASAAWQSVLGGAPLVLAALMFDSVDFGALSTAAWGYLAYMAVLPLCLSYIAWFAALRRLPATVATQGSLLAPMIGIATSAWFLGEPFGPRQVIAFLLTLVGVVLAVRG